MIKKINIEIDSIEDNKKIEEHLKRFIEENFKEYKTAKITINGI